MTTTRRAATRDKLVEAAVPVLARKGVRGASVEEICEAAGFTRGAFYSNFDSKEELCVAILERQAQRYLAAARTAIEAISADDPLEQRVREVSQVFIASTGSDADQVMVMSELRLHACREESMREAFTAFERSTTPVFGELVTQGLASQGARLTMPLDEALSLLHAVFDQTALDELLRGQPPNTPLAAERLAVVLQSLVTATE